MMAALAVVGVISISYLSDRWASPSRLAPSRARIEVPPPPPLRETAPARPETVHAPLAPPPARSEPAAQPARTETKAAQRAEGRAPGPQGSRAEARAGGEYWIQVGAFTEPANAARLAARLASENYPVKRGAIERPAGDSQTVFVAGASLDEVAQKLRGSEYRAESVGTEIAIKPSLPLTQAVALSKELVREGLAVKVRRSSSAGTLHVVRVGGYPESQRAEAVRRELDGKGFPGFLVRAQRQ